ncbi:MAG: hypothetical protein ACL93V_13230 [Candidatus Electrothrix sp. YB6]
MIEQLEIKNFRGFADYKIDDVGQIGVTQAPLLHENMLCACMSC